MYNRLRTRLLSRVTSRDAQLNTWSGVKLAFPSSVFSEVSCEVKPVKLKVAIVVSHCKCLRKRHDPSSCLEILIFCFHELS